MNSGLGILAVFALVGMNGFFVAGEFALVSVRKTRIEQLANEGNRKARRVLKALEHLDTYIAATQLGITMASLALGVVGEPAFAQLLAPLFHRVLPDTGAAVTAHGVALGLAFALVTSLHIVLGELAPKSIALQRTDVAAWWVTGPLNVFLRVFRPFILLLNAAGNGVVRLLGVEAVSEHNATHSVEELELLVHSTKEAGLLEQEQEKMVASVFHFEEMMIRKLMSPRPDILATRADATLEEAARLMTAHNHTRLPVYEGDLDNVIGILHIQTVLQALTAPIRPADLRELVRPPYFVPETKRAGYLMSELRRHESQMAIVRDEYGVVTGVVTIRDLIEEIVGEMQDGTDREEITSVTAIGERMWMADGKMSVEEFNRQMDMKLPVDEADTWAALSSA